MKINSLPTVIPKKIIAFADIFFVITLVKLDMSYLLIIICLVKLSKYKTGLDLPSIKKLNLLFLLKITVL